VVPRLDRPYFFFTMCERGIRAFLLCISAIPRSYSGSGILNRDAEGEEMPRLLVNGEVLFDVPDTSHEDYVVNPYFSGLLRVDMSGLDPEGYTHTIGISIDGTVSNIGSENSVPTCVEGELTVVVSDEGVGSFCLGRLQGVLETRQPVRPTQQLEPNGRKHWNDVPYFVR